MDQNLINCIKYFIGNLIRYCFPIISLSISVMVLVSLFSLNHGINFEHDANGYSIIVTALSILVAFLVAWQIITSFTVKKDIDELKSLRSTFDKQLEKAKEEIQGKIFFDTLSLAAFLKGITSEDKPWRIKTCFSSYYTCKDIKGNVTNSLAYDYLMLYLSEAIKDKKLSQYFFDILNELEAHEIEAFMVSIPDESKETKAFLSNLLNKKRNPDLSDTTVNEECSQPTYSKSIMDENNFLKLKQ